MILIVGLGNPGARYAGHRHNVGFMAADAIHDRHGFGPWRARFQGQAAEGALDAKKVVLLKPMTFMNESGRAVAAAVRFYKLTPQAVFVLYDEIDLVPGKLRVKIGGGAAGHNGIRSITAHIGPDYYRIRIGIGHPGDKDLVHSFVLSNFAKSDHVWLSPLLDAVADAAPILAQGDEGRFMNRVAVVTGTAADPKDLT